MLAILCGLGTIWGCGARGDTGIVEGVVTLDGQPLADGVVRFVPETGQSQTSSATVTEGEFSAIVSLGVMRVEFSAPKTIGKRKMYDTPDSPTVEVVGELIPERYNVQSELTLSVEAGKQSTTFELTSDLPRRDASGT